MSTKQENALIFAFTYMAFILGTTEYAIVGLLPEIGLDLNVSLATSGILVSGFAIAYAIGTPLILGAVNNMYKRPIILTALFLLSVLNLVSWWVSSFAVLLLLRIGIAVLCGLTLSLAVSVCNDFIRHERRGNAVSLIIGGFSIANVLGVPIGTLIGHHYKWSDAFVFVAAMGLLALLLIIYCLPKHTLPIQSSLKNQVRLFVHPRITLAFFIPVIGISSIFAIYTYITPILEQVLHVSKNQVSLYLLLYGAATIVSNIIGGQVASGNSIPKVKNVLLILSGIYLFFGLTISLPVLGITGLLMIGVVSYSINAPTQLYLIDLTSRLLPEAKDFSASLMPIAANIGIAAGSFIGGLVVDYGSLSALPWISLALGLAACALTALSYHLDLQLQARELKSRT